VTVPKQTHAPSTGERIVNHPFEWMGAIQAALKDAGIKMVDPITGGSPTGLRAFLISGAFGSASPEALPCGGHYPTPPDALRFRASRPTLRPATKGGGEAMLRKKLLVVGMSLALFVAGTGTAHAWDLIHSKDGEGHVTLRAWTRGYNQVAFVADHAGTRVDVAIVVNCRSGYHFDNEWSDGGRRFRFILRGLRDERRCDHTFKVDANDSSSYLNLALYAR